MHVGVTFVLISSWKETQSGTRTFHDVCCSTPCKPSTMVSLFLLLVAVSSTFADFKLHLFHTPRRASNLQKCLKLPTSRKNMKPLWKVKGFEQQTYCPRHRTAQRMTAQENKVDKETQKQTDKQGDTQHQTAQRTAARRSVIHSSPFSLLPSPSPLFFSSLPFSHTLLSYPLFHAKTRGYIVKKIEKQKTQPDNILASMVHQTRQENSQRQVL